jgi:hypothetical protein
MLSHNPRGGRVPAGASPMRAACPLRPVPGIIAKRVGPWSRGFAFSMWRYWGRWIVQNIIEDRFDQRRTIFGDQQTEFSAEPLFQSGRLVLTTIKVEGPRVETEEGLQSIAQTHRAVSRPKSLDLKVYCRRLAAVLFEFELDVLAFIECTETGALDRRDTNEHIPAPACGLNKTNPFCILNRFTLPVAIRASSIAPSLLPGPSPIL